MVGHLLIVRTWQRRVHGGKTRRWNRNTKVSGSETTFEHQTNATTLSASAS